MRKITLLLCVLIIFAVFTGCRGKRDVKLIVNYPDNWQVWYAADNQAATVTGYFRTVIPLGDYQSKATIAAWRINPPSSMNLDVQIVEEYQAGFLYVATSDVMADNNNTTNNANIGVIATYDFSATQ